MRKIIFILSLFLTISSFAQTPENEKIKYRKLAYNDFKKLSINDTSSAIIDLFFNKKDKAVFTQVILMPMSIILTIIPPTHFVGIGSLAISGPLFINGSVTLIKYRKKNLYKILTEYKKTQTLPKSIRRKANRILKNYKELQTDY